MGHALTGKTIAIAGSRKLEEISALIEKQGGMAVIRPLQGTVFLAEKEVEPDLRKFIEEGADWVILTTGIGTDTLIDLADKMGKKAEFLSRLNEAKIGARGYKTLGVLKKIGITPVAIDDDGTNRGLVRNLQHDDFTGKRVLVQLHGEAAPSLIRFLEENGATVQQILPYQHIPPQTETVEQLCQELLSHKVNAVCFTTAVQVRFLFEYAKEKGIVDKLIDVFNSDALAVAVGKITAEAIREEGVERLIAPEFERMGAMIIELARYYEQIETSN
ncbi:uroporphyrinogen-III synthase [Bacillus sp. DNRA2]|uniref:uroporphyrinogen-III synthase n=1 Tax=Bacillus sp. DNRA2 TaxID=2723053 RepID=UPI00145F0855|nr:uroporphyrinogen-III synthase [Bacillus sp. DNRA2]NMD69885.1 uroporphyrinogen-III synthase [Bacillus sp. DNRA2]